LIVVLCRQIILLIHVSHHLLFLIPSLCDTECLVVLIGVTATTIFIITSTTFSTTIVDDRRIRRR
jgi:hypothetical protein